MASSTRSEADFIATEGGVYSAAERESPEGPVASFSPAVALPRGGLDLGLGARWTCKLCG